MVKHNNSKSLAIGKRFMDEQKKFSVVGLISVNLLKYLLGLSRGGRNEGFLFLPKAYPETAAGNRTIPIADPLYPVFESIKPKDATSDAIVFTTQISTQRKNNMVRAFRRDIQNAIISIGEKMTPDEIRTWRKNHNLSQEKLARLLDMSTAAVVAWEGGTRRPPGILKLALEALENKLDTK